MVVVVTCVFSRIYIQCMCALILLGYFSGSWQVKEKNNLEACIFSFNVGLFDWEKKPILREKLRILMVFWMKFYSFTIVGQKMQVL